MYDALASLNTFRNAARSPAAGWPWHGGNAIVDWTVAGVDLMHDGRLWKTLVDKNTAASGCTRSGKFTAAGR